MPASGPTIKWGGRDVAVADIQRVAEARGTTPEAIARLGTWQGRLESRFGSTVAGQTMMRAEQGIGGLMGSVVSLGSRAGLLPESWSAKIHKEKQDRATFLALIEDGADVEDVLGERGSRIYSNATSSLAAAGIAAPAGVLSVYATTGAEVFDNSLHQAEQAGKQGAEAVEFAGKQALIETGVSVLMGRVGQKLGLTTLEESLSPGMRAAASRLTQKIVGKNFSIATRGAGLPGGITAEAAEEGIVSLLQQAVEMDHGLRESLDWEQVFEAGATGGLARGMSGAANTLTEKLKNQSANIVESIKGVKAAEEAIEVIEPQMAPEAQASVKEAERAAMSPEDQAAADKIVNFQTGNKLDESGSEGRGARAARKFFNSMDAATLEKLAKPLNKKEFEALTGLKKTSQTFRDSFRETVNVYTGLDKGTPAAAPDDATPAEPAQADAQTTPDDPQDPGDATAPQTATQGPTTDVVEPAPVKLGEFIRDYATDKVAAFRKFAQKNFTSDGLLDAAFARSNDRRIGKVAEEIRRASDLSRDAMRALKTEFGGRSRLTQQEVAKVNDALAGRPSDFSTETLAAVNKMRAHIDRMSKTLRHSGMIDPESDLALTMEENEGSYLNRTYRKHIDQNWATRVKKTMPEVVDAARGWLHEQFPEESAEQIEWRINAILDKDSALANANPPGKAENKFLDILKRRKSIPKEIRDLMGEIRDPFVNYTNSVAKIAGYLAHTEFVNDVKEQGLAAGLLQPADQVVDASLMRTFDGNKNRLLKPLEGWYGDPQTIEAIESVFDTDNHAWAYRQITRVSGYAKWAQTVGNPAGYARNFLGNVAFAMSNGDLIFSRKAWKDAGRFWLAEFKGTNDSDLREYMYELTKLGVVGQDVRTSEIREMTETMTQMFDDAPGPLKAFAAVKKGTDKLSSVYQSMDTVWKVIAFEHKKRQYAEAFPDATVAEIKNLAAEDVKAHYPTWSKVPKGVRAISKNPVVGAFVSFHSEVLRTLKNQLVTSREQMQSDNPVLRRMGYQRAIGLAGSLVMFDVLSMISRQMFDISDDEDQAIRKFVPSWTRNSPYLYVGRGEDGKYETLDLGFMDARAILTKPLRALANDGPLDERLTTAAGELLDPLGEDLLFGQTVSALRNQTPEGFKVYDEAGTTEEKARDLAKHFGRVMLPGAVNKLDRWVKAYNGEISRGGAAYDTVLETAGLLLARPASVDVATAYTSRSAKLRDLIKQSEFGILSEFKSRGTVKPGRLQEVYRGFSETRKKYAAQLHDLTAAAIKLGAPPESIEADLTKIGKERAMEIWANRLSPYVPGEETLQQIRSAPDGNERIRILRDMAREQLTTE